MSWLLSVYRQIPTELFAPVGAFLAASLAALVAFTGVVLSNRAAERRQRLELEAAEKRARIERDHTLRETIYLEALNDLGSLLGKAFDLWNVEKALSMSGDEFSKLTGSTYRTYLVAGSRTIQALADVSEAMSAAAAAAAPLRVHYSDMTAGLQHLESLVQRIQIEHKRLVDEVVSGSPDADRKTAIEARKAELPEMERTAVGRLLEAKERQVQLAMDILLLGVKRKCAVEKLVFALIVAVRDELSLPAIGEEALKVLANAEGQSLRVVTQLVDDLKAITPSLMQRARAIVAQAK